MKHFIKLLTVTCVISRISASPYTPLGPRLQSVYKKMKQRQREEFFGINKDRGKVFKRKVDDLYNINVTSPDIIKFEMNSAGEWQPNLVHSEYQTFDLATEEEKNREILGKIFEKGTDNIGNSLKKFIKEDFNHIMSRNLGFELGKFQSDETNLERSSPGITHHRSSTRATPHRSSAGAKYQRSSPATTHRKATFTTEPSTTSTVSKLRQPNQAYVIRRYHSRPKILNLYDDLYEEGIKNSELVPVSPRRNIRRRINEPSIKLSNVNYNEEPWRPLPKYSIRYGGETSEGAKKGKRDISYDQEYGLDAFNSFENLLQYSKMAQDRSFNIARPRKTTRHQDEIDPEKWLQRFYGDNTLNKDNKAENVKSTVKDMNEKNDYEYEYIYMYDDDYEEIKELTTSSDMKPWGKFTKSSDRNKWTDDSELRDMYSWDGNTEPSDIYSWDGNTESPKDAMIISSNNFENTKIERTLTAGISSNQHSNSLDLAQKYTNNANLVDPITSNPFNNYYNSESVDYSTEYPLWSSTTPPTTTTSTSPTHQTTLTPTPEPIIRWGSVTLAPRQSNPLWGKQKDIMKNNHLGNMNRNSDLTLHRGESRPDKSKQKANKNRNLLRDRYDSRRKNVPRLEYGTKKTVESFTTIAPQKTLSTPITYTSPPPSTTTTYAQQHQTSTKESSFTTPQTMETTTTSFRKDLFNLPPRIPQGFDRDQHFAGIRKLMDLLDLMKPESKNTKINEHVNSGTYEDDYQVTTKTFDSDALLDDDNIFIGKSSLNSQDHNNQAIKDKVNAGKLNIVMDSYTTTDRVITSAYQEVDTTTYPQPTLQVIDDQTTLEVTTEQPTKEVTTEQPTKEVTTAMPAKKVITSQPPIKVIAAQPTIQVTTSKPIIQVTTDKNPRTTDYRVQFQLKRRHNTVKDRSRNRNRYKQRYGSKVKSYESLNQYFKEKEKVKEEKIAELQETKKTEDVKSSEELLQVESSDAKSDQTQSNKSNFQHEELLKGMSSNTAMSVSPVYELSLAGLFSTVKPTLIVEQVFKSDLKTQTTNVNNDIENTESYILFDKNLVKKVELEVKTEKSVPVQSSINWELDDVLTESQTNKTNMSTESPVSTTVFDDEGSNPTLTSTIPQTSTSPPSVDSNTKIALDNSTMGQKVKKLKPLFPNFPGSGKESAEVSTRRPEQSSEVSTRRPEQSSEVSTRRPEQSSEVSTRRPEQSSEVSTRRPEQSSEVSTRRPEQSSEVSTRRPEQSSEVSTRRSLDAPRRKLKQGSLRKGIIRQRRRRSTTPRTDSSSRISNFQLNKRKSEIPRYH